MAMVRDNRYISYYVSYFMDCIDSKLNIKTREQTTNYFFYSINM